MRISDWSSDVCSSDLSSIPRAPCPARRIAKRPNVSPPCKGGAGGGLRATRAADAGPSNHRRPAVRAPGERVDTQRRHAVALRVIGVMDDVIAVAVLEQDRKSTRLNSSH